MVTYYAKSVDENGHQETVQEHLQKVCLLAACFGKEIGLEQEASLCGILHDFGKYSVNFQNVLKRCKTNVNHAFPGAVYLHSRKRNKKGQEKPVVPSAYRNVVEAIAAHHDGLLFYDQIRSTLDDSISKDAPLFQADKEVSLSGFFEYQEASLAFSKDFPDFKIQKLEKVNFSNEIEYMMKSRMLLSCLVDADYSVSGGHEIYSPVPPLDAESALKKLLRKITSVKKDSTANSILNTLRNEVFDQCGKSGCSHETLFTLTAPTGIGKTYALLHFALRHCLEVGKQRVIIVLPFLSLAEQTHKIYSELIPDILVDHSQNNLDDSQRELAERWDSPFIITTSVKFFELLFKSRPSDLRKLHHLANSIVIFDEAQSLPAELASSTIQAIHTLCTFYNTSVVFSTATQPDFSFLKGTCWKPTELLPAYRKYYQTLRRVSVSWKLSEPIPLSVIAEQMISSRNVCSIVNLRKHARILFQELQSRLINTGDDSLFLLSTDLCPAHRLKVIDQIKRRQASGLPCYVVSTQCIEAGVDLDFDDLFRALAPLEAIIQSAGRCNRNGKKISGGKVTVFIPDEKNLYPDKWYQKCSIEVKSILAEHNLDINNPDHIREYYEHIFYMKRDNPNLLSAISRYDYFSVSKEYRLIDNTGIRVIVPWDGYLDLYRAIYEEAQNGITKELMRRAAPITVTVFSGDILDLYAEKLFLPSRHGEKPTESGFYIIRHGKEECYHAQTGLFLDLTDTTNIF